MLLPAVASAQRTAQDIESARQLYNQGMNLKEKGDLPGALEKLRAAHALGNTPVTGLELCRVHAALEQPVEAREICLGVSRIPPLAQETQRSQEARAEATRLAESEKPKIGALRLKVTGVPPGFAPTVVVDGATVPLAALGEPRAVNPGTHTVSARVGSGVETKATLETREGELRDVELIVQAPPPDERPAPPVGAQPETSPPGPREKKESHPLVTVGLAVTGVGALVGTLAGVIAMSKEGDLSDKCIGKNCGRELHDELDSAKTWGNVSTAFFIVGGIGLGTSLIAMLAASSTKSASTPAKTRVASTPHITPVLGLGGAGIHGSF